MNPFLPRTCAAIAATVALSTAATAIPQAAHAYLIKRTTMPLPPIEVNPSLPAPTVIDFDRPNADVTNAELVPSSNPNGSANIQLAGGSADYFNNELRIGRDSGSPPRNGQVSFGFGDPRGMGYIGFSANASNPSQTLITFLNNGVAITSFSVSALLNNTVQNSTVVGTTGNYFSFFVTNNDEIFDQVLFADTSNGQGQGALVIDNLAYQAIPTPALLPALVGFGLGLVRKKKAQAEAEA